MKISLNVSITKLKSLQQSNKYIKIFFVKNVIEYELSKFLIPSHLSKFQQTNLSGVMRKPVFGISDKFRHKPGCTATEDGYRLKISDLGSREIVLSVQRKERR